ncbi:hypothetical protein L226DRAFT_12497 [Lentinus tigrinus ALCF2SS1-7]|uniref:uncharacterized protein n=1 Tax=Lentinus tigrinus ALCF2SS1-7 TaxID=1328758 RepID=UPI0011663AC8|nr:hypothetical protein L226DRAFT_12497 [Lentinus tigrinus ALCF2SS1-7]
MAASANSQAGTDSEASHRTYITATSVDISRLFCKPGAVDHHHNRLLRIAPFNLVPVKAGDVGYIDDAGRFSCLFNAFEASRSSDGRMTCPSLGSPSYAGVRKARLHERGGDLQHGLPTQGWARIRNFLHLPSWLRWRDPLPGEFRFPAGRMCAGIYTDGGTLSAIEGIDTAKQWIESHCASVREEYGGDHPSLRNSHDVLLVVGALRANRYARIASIDHKAGTATFHPDPHSTAGHCWGVWSYDPPEDLSGSELCDSAHLSRMDRKNALLLACIKFDPVVGLIIRQLYR